jgi:peroxiredoxin
MIRSRVARVGLAVVISVATVAVAYFLGVKAGNLVNAHRFRESREKTTEALLNRMQTLRVGDTLSDHTFEDLKQQRTRLTDMVHGRTLLMFLSPDCSMCLDELENLRNAIADSSDFRHFVLISPDDRLDLLRAQELYDIPCPILWDRDNTYAGNLQINAQPFNVVVSGSLEIERLAAGPLSEKELREIVE